MPATLQPDLYPQLITLINETYTDKVESIIAAQVDDDDGIDAIAMDGRKRLAAKIADNGIQIKHLH
jgi:hypothetical protein